MLTEQEAVEKAWALIRERKVHVVGLEHDHKFSTAHATLSSGPRGDFWSVIFAVPRDPQVRIPGDSVVVLVSDGTGEAVIQKKM